MNFVDDQNGFLTGGLKPIRSAGYDASHFGDVAFHSAEADEFRMRHFRDDVSERGFAGAGRPGEDHGRETIGLDGATQKFSRPEDVLLSDEFFERARTHPGGQRRG